MTCKEFTDWLGEYVDDDCQVDIRADCRQHAADCRNCTAYWRSYRMTIEVARAAYAKSDRED